jgi:hypothetical protein
MSRNDLAIAFFVLSALMVAGAASASEKSQFDKLLHTMGY